METTGIKVLSVQCLTLTYLSLLRIESLFQKKKRYFLLIVLASKQDFNSFKLWNHPVPPQISPKTTLVQKCQRFQGLVTTMPRCAELLLTKFSQLPYFIHYFRFYIFDHVTKDFTPTFSFQVLVYSILSYRHHQT